MHGFEVSDVEHRSSLLVGLFSSILLVVLIVC